MKRHDHTIGSNSILTPENAQEQGYEWIRDIPNEATLEAAQEIVEALHLAATLDYMLGKCKYDNNDPTSFAPTGLYKRFSKPE